MTQQPPLRTGHPYYMYDAIRSQPEAVADVLARSAEGAGTAVNLLESRSRLTLAGIGTSYHAATVGEYLFRILTQHRLTPRSAHSFDLFHYGAMDERDGLIVVSHRGTKTYSNRALERAKEQGAAGVAITGIGSGAAMDTADVVLQTVLQEKSAAHTVSYTTAMTTLALIAMEAARREGAPDKDAEAALSAMDEALDRALELEDQVKDLARRYASHDRWLFLGAGPNAPTAWEAALKMKEANYTDSEGLHTEQALHGPPAHFRSQMVVVVIAPPGSSYERGATVLRVARSLGAPAIALVEEGDAGPATETAQHTLHLPAVPEALSPLVYVAPLQLLTYHVALARGTNPDTMHRDNPTYAQAHALYEL